MKRVSRYFMFCAAIAAPMIYAQNDYRGDVFTDSPAYSINTEFRALFFKPGASHLHYAAEAFPFKSSIATPLFSPHWNIYDLHPRYHFGFDLGLRGVFHERNSSLSINWEHFKSRTKACTPAISTGEFPNPMMGPLSSIGPDAAPYNILASGSVTFNFNEVDIRYGQYVEFGDYLETNLFAGIGGAGIKQCITAFYVGDGNISQTITIPTTFSGAGPELGVDFSYDTGCSFSLTGQLTSLLLMGRAKNHTIYASRSPVLVDTGNPSPNIQSTCAQNRTQVVPSISQRLAIAYSRLCGNRYHTRSEVGFETKVFFNALQSTNLASGVIDIVPEGNTVGVFARTFERSISNFSLFGPYIAVSMSF